MDQLLLRLQLEILADARAAALDSKEAVKAARVRLQVAAKLTTRMQMLVQETDKVLRKYGIPTPAMETEL
jgi:hypothetical protein